MNFSGSANRKKCAYCGAKIPASRRAGVAYCSDACGARARNAKAYAKRTDGKTPPIKWAGSKRWIVEKSAPLHRIFRYHRHRRLVEPFGGSLAVSLGLLPERALIGDVLPYAVAFYELLKTGLVIPDDVPVDRSKETFEANKKRFNALLAAGDEYGIEAAGLFYALVKSGFNGLWRVNAAGRVNMAWGGGGVPLERDLRAYAPQMKAWDFFCGDFSSTPIVNDDFLFIDPPYDGTQTHTAYAARKFSWADQVRLATWAARHPGPVVATNFPTPRILDLYRDLGFDVRRVRTKHFVAGGRAKTVLEMLATRNVRTAAHSPRTPINASRRDERAA